MIYESTETNSTNIKMKRYFSNDKYTSQNMISRSLKVRSDNTIENTFSDKHIPNKISEGTKKHQLFEESSNHTPSSNLEFNHFFNAPTEKTTQYLNLKVTVLGIPVETYINLNRPVNLPAHSEVIHNIKTGTVSLQSFANSKFGESVFIKASPQHRNMTQTYANFRTDPLASKSNKNRRSNNHQHSFNSKYTYSIITTQKPVLNSSTLKVISTYNMSGGPITDSDIVDTVISNPKTISETFTISITTPVNITKSMKMRETKNHISNVKIRSSVSSAKDTLNAFKLNVTETKPISEDKTRKVSLDSNAKDNISKGSAGNIAINAETLQENARRQYARPPRIPDASFKIKRDPKIESLLEEYRSLLNKYGPNLQPEQPEKSEQQHPNAYGTKQPRNIIRLNKNNQKNQGQQYQNRGSGLNNGGPYSEYWAQHARPFLENKMGRTLPGYAHG